jgi:hypothetical protein
MQKVILVAAGFSLRWHRLERRRHRPVRGNFMGELTDLSGPPEISDYLFSELAC